MSRLASLATAALFAASPALADTKLTQESQFEMKAMGGMQISTSSVESVAGERSRTESDTAVQDGMMGRMGGGGAGNGRRHEVRISRPDKGVFWTVDAEGKTYREAQMAEMGKMMREMGGGGGGRDGGGQGRRHRKTVTKADAKVTGPNGQQTIGAYPCTAYDLIITVDTKDDTGAGSIETIKERIWTTKETAVLKQARADLMALGKAMMKAMGSDEEPSEWMFGMERMIGMGGLDRKELSSSLKTFAAEFKKIDGFAIQREIDWTRKIQGVPGAENGAPALNPTEQAALDAAAAFLGGSEKSSVDLSSVLKGKTTVLNVESAKPAADAFDLPAGYTKAEGRQGRWGGGEGGGGR